MTASDPNLVLAHCRVFQGLLLDHFSNLKAAFLRNGLETLVFPWFNMAASKKRNIIRLTPIKLSNILNPIGSI